MARTGMDALRRAVAILGSQTALARVVGVRPQSVSEKLSIGKRVPAEWCIPLENATRAKGETVSRHELRPDLYPPPDAAPAKAPKPARGPRGGRMAAREVAA